MRYLTAVIPALMLMSASCSKQIDIAGTTAAVQAMLDKQVEAWNNGDLDGYLDAYLEADSVRFAAGRVITKGFGAIGQRMKSAYPDAAAMGMLRFIDIEIEVLSHDAALVFGKWMLSQENNRPWGLFTLLVRNTENGWKIAHDHTSSAVN